jgi:hypothetical protein
MADFSVLVQSVEAALLQGEEAPTDAAAAQQQQKPTALSSADFERTFSRDSKASLGRRAKELIDLCRTVWLQQALGYRVKLVRFTTRSVEDRLIVAAWSRPNNNDDDKGPPLAGAVLTADGCSPETNSRLFKRPKDASS